MSAVQTESVGIKPVAHRALGRQFIYNSAATALLYAVTLLIGIWYPPFTLHHLGITLQATVQLAASFVYYMQFATTGISSSVGRLVMADAARGDMEAANRTFNTFIVAAQRVVLISLVGIAAMVFFVVPRFNHPEGQLTATRFLFAAILGSALIQVFNMCLDSCIWVSGRIDVRSSIFIVEIMVRSGSVVVLFSLANPSLWHIGIAALVAPLSSLVLYYISWKKLAPELTLNRGYFDLHRFREIRGQGGWMLVYQIGTALQFNADIILLNLLLGSTVQGFYGMLLTWGTIFRGLLGSMGQLLASSLAAFQASEEHERLAGLALKGVRMQGMLISIPVGVLCGLAGPALNWWLGPEFTFIAPLAWLILVPLVLEGSFNPVLVVVQAPDAVAFASKAVVGLGILNVLLGITLVKFTSLGMYGIALAVATTSVVRHGIVLPIYAARVIRLPWYSIIQQQAQIIIQLGITAVLGMYAAQFVHSRSFIQLFLAACAAGTVAAAIAAAQLNQDERARILSLIQRR